MQGRWCKGREDATSILPAKAARGHSPSWAKSRRVTTRGWEWRMQGWAGTNKHGRGRWRSSRPFQSSKVLLAPQSPIPLAFPRLPPQLPLPPLQILLTLHPYPHPNFRPRLGQHELCLVISASSPRQVLPPLLESTCSLLGGRTACLRTLCFILGFQ